jgi:hypothetical protein
MVMFFSGQSRYARAYASKFPLSEVSEIVIIPSFIINLDAPARRFFPKASIDISGIIHKVKEFGVSGTGVLSLV